MDLAEKQKAELWGDGGPYSELKCIIEHRILDDSVSRVFLRVEANINPFTFRAIKKKRKEFSDDKAIQGLLNNAEYLGIENGYLSIAFQRQILANDDDEMYNEIKEIVQETREAIIKMHKYVLEMIDNPALTIEIKQGNDK